MELHKVVTSKQSQYIGSKTKKKKSFYCLIQLQESVSLHHKLLIYVLTSFKNLQTVKQGNRTLNNTVAYHSSSESCTRWNYYY